jgi:hypothetical protein
MDPLLMILKRLSDHGVDFVLIGSFAAMGHGSPIVTQDVDVCAPLVRPNLDQIIGALRDLNPYFRFRAGQKLRLYDDPARLVGFKNIYLETDWGVLDILGDLPGVGPFEQIARTAETIDFGGFTCRMLDLDTLIAAKRAAGRPKDLVHLRHLEALKKLRDARDQGTNPAP